MCHLCYAAYKGKQNLKGHLLKAHGLGTPLKCPCGETFAWNQTFNIHKKTCPVAQQQKTSYQQLENKENYGYISKVSYPGISLIQLILSEGHIFQQSFKFG